MRKIWFLLALILLVPPSVFAQNQHYSDVPRYELGLQVDIANLNGINEWGGGVGARFHYNLNEHFALDSQLTYRQHNIAVLSGIIPSSSAIGQTDGLFGVRAGVHQEDVGFFAHARAGFMHFGEAQGASLLTRNTFPMFDVGGTIERYSGPVILRLELGEQIVAYGNAQLSFGSPMLQPPPPLGRLGTRIGPVLGLGFAVRF